MLKIIGFMLGCAATAAILYIELMKTPTDSEGEKPVLAIPLTEDANSVSDSMPPSEQAQLADLTRNLQEAKAELVRLQQKLQDQALDLNQKEAVLELAKQENLALETDKRALTQKLITTETALDELTAKQLLSENQALIQTKPAIEFEQNVVVPTDTTAADDQLPTADIALADENPSAIDISLDTQQQAVWAPFRLRSSAAAFAEKISNWLDLTTQVLKVDEGYQVVFEYADSAERTEILNKINSELGLSIVDN